MCSKQSSRCDHLYLVLGKAVEDKIFFEGEGLNKIHMNTVLFICPNITASASKRSLAEISANRQIESRIISDLFEFI